MLTPDFFADNGFFWRPMSPGGVASLGPVEIWMPDGVVKVHDKYVTVVANDTEVLAIKEALKL